MANIDAKKLKEVMKQAEGQYTTFVDKEIPEPKKVVDWQEGKGKNRLLVLYTGGTLGMEPKEDPESGEEVLKSSLSLEKLLTISDMVTGFKDNTNVLGYHVSHIDSTEINVKVWDNMAELIQKHYEEIDGVVILHGTDTMAYTASAMAFSLRNLAIPIVTTGAQHILRKNGTDVIGNLTGAIEVASNRLAGSLLYFNGNIFNGTRVSKEHDEEVVGFGSPVYGRIGYLGANGVRFDGRAMKRGTYAPSELVYDPGFATSVAQIAITPLSRPSQIGQAAMDKGCKALSINSFGPGNVPSWYLPVIEYLTKEAGFPVFVSSQCAGSGISEGSHYAVGAAVRKAGGVPVMDMGPESTAVKLMKVMNRTDKLNVVNREMLTPYAGEITAPR
jgi:L-asparaginase